MKREPHFSIDIYSYGGGEVGQLLLGNANTRIGVFGSVVIQFNEFNPALIDSILISKGQWYLW